MRSGPDQFSPIRRAAKTFHRALSRCQPNRLREGLLFWLLFWGGMVSTPMAQAEEAGFLDALIDDRSNVMVVLDASQAVTHRRVDVRALDVDFLAWTGHKLYGPTGIGVLYGTSDLLAV